MREEFHNWSDRLRRWLVSQSGHEGHGIMTINVYSQHKVYGESAGKIFIHCTCGERLEYRGDE